MFHFARSGPLLYVGVFVACVQSGGSETDQNKPATFFDTCDPANNHCAAPFQCLKNPLLTGAGYCTLSCTSTTQCPAWHATGHCAGPFQSQCLSGVCQYGCE